MKRFGIALAIVVLFSYTPVFAAAFTYSLTHDDENRARNITALLFQSSLQWDKPFINF